MPFVLTPTVERLGELLDYDPGTGVFRWKVRRGGTASVGAIAGNLSTPGHRQICVDGRFYQAHRLAWKIMTGTDAAGDIDHINQRKDDNRFTNLREATRQQNCWNKGPRSDSGTGLRGVNRVSDSRFRAYISVAGKRMHLGSFKTAEEAAIARAHVAREAHGEFYAPPGGG